MVRARKAVLAAGGAARCNVFTRITLALFGQVPWRAVPSMPVEVIYLPRFFPFHLSKVSYWSRTTIVPLTILLALKPRARNPRGIGIAELFTTPPEQDWNYFPSQTGTERLFMAIDRGLALFDSVMPRALRRRAIDLALNWCLTRLNGEDGLGAIFPAMANLLMALDTLGHAREHPARHTARRAIDRLLTKPENGSQYCQPCVSPVWDTGLAALSLPGVRRRRRAARRMPVPPLAQRPADPRCRRRLGRGAAGCAAGGMGLSVPQRLLPGRGRHRGRGHGAPPRRSRGSSRSDRTGGCVGRRHAKREWRLGRLRCRERALHPQPDPLRRSRSPARPGDRRRQRAVRELSLSDRLFARSRRRRQRPRLPARDPGGERLLVRPLGDQLHLRHLVGSLRVERRRRRPGVRRHPQRGGLARSQAACRRRLGRDRRQLLCGPHRAFVRSGLDSVADRMGPCSP